MVTIDSDAVVLRADGKSVRRIYVKPIFSKFDLIVLRGENPFPYRTEVLMENFEKGLCCVEIGPAPINAPVETYSIRLLELYAGSSFIVQVSIL